MVIEFIISIHALLAECDYLAEAEIDSTVDFNPRTPRGVRRGHTLARRVQLDFNPRTPRGVRRSDLRLFERMKLISIHALLAECDPRPTWICQAVSSISIHALLAECDKNGAKGP